MENLDWLFPSWKKLAEHYKETWTVETLHFYSNQDANKTYFMLKDAGYKCAVELNYNCASFVWVWVPKNKLKFFPRATFYPKGN